MTEKPEITYLWEKRCAATQVHAMWPNPKILMVGHSNGGLVAKKTWCTSTTAGALPTWMVSFRSAQ